MSYEEEHYGIKHLYTHTSWTHIGPVADRPDLEVSDDTLFFADFADIICMNVYTYARGVKTSPGGSVTGRPYQGYIEDLIKISHKPVVITQVGLSTSPNAPDSDIPDFGGNSYEKVSSVFSNVWEDIKTASGSSTINGVAWFEFMDEWWKNGEDSNDELSHNDSDPEEWFGMYSVNDDYKSLSAKGSIPGTVKDLFTNSIPSDSNVPKGSVSINSGADYTNSTTVTLSLSATDVEGVTGYCVSTGSSTPLLYSTKWVSATATTSYTGSVSYSFSGGDGSKTVYVWYKDTDGNVSDTTSDSIILNKTAPTVAITSPSSNPNYTTTNSAINLSGNASDSASGLSGIAWRNSKGGSGTASGTDNWTISSIALL